MSVATLRVGAVAGMLGGVAMAMLQYGVWRAVDPVAAGSFTPWVLAVAHLAFGMTAAPLVGIVVPDAQRGQRCPQS